MTLYAPALEDRTERLGRYFRLADVWGLICRQAALVVLTTLAVTVFATLYVLQVRPDYAASAEVMLDPRKSSVENTASVLSNLTADQPTILNQVEILTSHRFAWLVVEKLHLENDPEFSAPGLAGRLFDGGEDPREIAVRNLRKRLSVAQAGFSSTIRITVSAKERDKATRIAAAMAQLYVSEQLDTKSLASEQASRWLTQRIAELARQVKDAEAAVQKYKADHRITTTADGTSVLEQQIADLSGQLTTAKTDYDGKAANAARMAGLVRSGDASASPQAVGSLLISSLRTQQSELNRDIANTATKYGPNHPHMRELLAQRADLETKISQETLRIADSVRNEAETARSHVASLQSSLKQMEDQNARQNQAAVELTALQSAAASARAMYQAFLTQYSQTENQEGILRPDAYVISASDVSEAFGPQAKLLAILSAMPAGFLLGLVLAFAVERLPANAPAEERLPAAKRTPTADMRAAAVLPQTGFAAADLSATQPQAPFAQAVSDLLRILLLRKTPARLVAVTSTVPGEGKTTLSLALARAAALAGLKTIVVDANRVQFHLGAMARQTALSPWQAPRRGLLDELIERDSLTSALLLAPNTPQEAVALTPPVLTRLACDLTAAFDLVIVNAPPYGDAIAQAAFAVADTVLFLADARRPPRHAPASIPGKSLVVRTHAR